MLRRIDESQRVLRKIVRSKEGAIHIFTSLSQRGRRGRRARPTNSNTRHNPSRQSGEQELMLCPFRVTYLEPYSNIAPVQENTHHLTGGMIPAPSSPSWQHRRHQHITEERSMATLQFSLCSRTVSTFRLIEQAPSDRRDP